MSQPDNLQYASRPEIAAHQLAGLRELVSFLQHESSNTFYQQKLAGIEASRLMDLTELPFTTKSELVAEHRDYPPYGRNLSYPLAHYSRLHQTSGTTGRPLPVLDTLDSWQWWADCWLQVFEGAGVTAEDRVFLAFSFGPFIGFWAAHEGAAKLGALIIPGGGMDTDQRLAALFEHDVTVVCCTPSYSLYLAEAATVRGLDLARSGVRVLLQAGEPGASLPAVRRRIEEAWGAKCYDHAGASEIGAYGFSCAAQNGLHFNEREFMVEVLEPGREYPVPPGEIGELVLTNLGRRGFPVIRYRTGDVVKLATGPCECGRTYQLAQDGLIGRTDSMITVRGINVYPSSVEAIIREVVPVCEFKLIFYRENNLDELAIEIELAEAERASQLAKLESFLRQRLALRVKVSAVEPDTLPRFQLKARRLEDRRPRLS